MKIKGIKVVAIAMMLTATCSVQAQISLGNVLKSVKETASSAVTASGNSIASNLTTIFSSSKVATTSDIVGSWSYTEPAIVFQSSNVLKNYGGKVVSATLEKTLKAKLSKYGITKGKLTMTFDKDGNFTQAISGKKLTGTYTISGKNVVLKYAGQVQQIVGTTQVDGNDLLIVMDASKMLSYMKTLGTLSGNTTLKTASSLVGSFDGMLCGLRLQK